MQAPHVLVLDLAACDWGDNRLELLSQAERERARRFVRPLRRRQFVAGRLLARALLSRLSPSARLRERPPLPPAVLSPAGLSLSISHSGAWVACAVARGPVGIDLEDRAIARDPIALADAALTREQADWVRDSADPALSFHQLWTLHECLIKWPAGPTSRLGVKLGAGPALSGATDEEWLCHATPDYVLSVVAYAARASQIEILSCAELCARLP